MNEIGVVGIVIIIANVLISFSAFRNPVLLNSLSFNVHEILKNKDYKRMFTSGFVHVDTTHLLFNMLSFYFFANAVEESLGIPAFILLYIGSLLGGNLLSLWLNRFNPMYTAVGASGAVSGVIFAAIALKPGMGIGLFFIVGMPGWLYALAFIIYSIYGIRTKRDNIGHEAHLGGAIIGMVLAVLYKPQMLVENTFPILITFIPTAIFLIMIQRGISIGISSKFKAVRPARERKPQYFDVDDYYRDRKKRKELELNSLLEKVGKEGIESLSEKERQRLDDLSK